MKQLLSWPKALKELWYEVNQGEWDEHYQEPGAQVFTCWAISRALAPLAGSLEKLTFTRTNKYYKRFFYNGAIDLRDCEKLKELRTFYALLVGGHELQEDIWTNIPKNLESWEV